MWGLTKISVALLATRAPEKYSPDATGQVVNDARSVYTTLREKAPVFTEYSTTVRFSYVTPPTENGNDWSDYDVMMSDADIMEMSDSDDEDLRRTQMFSEVANRHGSKKPIALFLPGLDGYGISAGSFQFNDMSKTFELWRMSVVGEDRTSFHDLVQQPVKFIQDIVKDTDRPVYVIGESFGGMLTPAVCLQFLQQAGIDEDGGERKNPIKGMVLVNPATSFERSSWDVIAPILTTLGKLTTQPEPTQVGPFKLPSLYSVVGGLTLSAVIPSQKQYQKIFDTFMNIESIGDPSQITETIQGFLEMFEITSEFLPPDLLEHRIKNWLLVGSSVLVESRLKQLDIPSLVICGEQDNLINSKDEAKRLTKILPQSEELTVRDAGHFILDENVNLTEAILYSKIDPLKYIEEEKSYDPILDWEMPSTEKINQTLSTSVKRLEDDFSPVWISTNMEGKRSFGIGNVPREGTLLFVSNHQLCTFSLQSNMFTSRMIAAITPYENFHSHNLISFSFAVGADLSLLVGKLYKNGLCVRGLAHPVIFQGSGGAPQSGSRLRKSRQLGRVPGIEAPPTEGNNGNFQGGLQFEEFGAVMVTPRNFYRLMQTGQNALLFPGGVREVFHGKDESYQLFWPEKVDFVRTAARFNATIIPVSAVGMADSFNILLDSKELLDVPVLGQRAKDFASNVTAARFDTDNEDELFLPPIAVPGPPSRNYFVFGKPIHTHELDPKDKEACKTTYLNIQEEMATAFHDVLEAREKDTFKDAAPRLAYERLTGQKAPSFNIDEMN